MTGTGAAYEEFSRARWAALGRAAGRGLTEAETARLTATGEPVSTEEVAQVYRPLADLLALRAAHRRQMDGEVRRFLRSDRAAGPFVIGIAGSVAVGKSTTARVLAALLAGTPGTTVELLTTDGFLYPNAVLEERGLMERKGFPESYDRRALIAALGAIRSGVPEVPTPVYSHLAYDIVPGRVHVVRAPDVLIVEGLNVLQMPTQGAPPADAVASDFFDFSIYVDAAEDDIARWFTERLLALRSTVLQEPASFFHRLAELPTDEVVTLAADIWARINLVNLRENVAPTRDRAHLVLQKGADHRVARVLLRRG